MNNTLTSAFSDISTHTKNLSDQLETLNLAVDALKGIGNMLRITQINADEELSARRSDAAAVFQFFGTTLTQPISIAQESKDFINNAVYRATQGDCHE